MAPPPKAGLSRKSGALRSRDNNRAAPPATADVIILSSDDEDIPATRSAVKRKRQPTSRTSSAKATSMSVPDSAAQAQAGSSTVSRLTRELDAMKKANERLEIAKARAEEKLANALARTSRPVKYDLTELETLTSCEICTLRMWTPYTLVECGHTYCEKCLHGWFDTIFTQHVAQHPDYLAEPPPLPAAWARNAHNAQVAAAIAEYRAQLEQRRPQPAYTCPMCRVPVRVRPVEVFALKEVVRRVAKMEGGGEQSPKRTVNRAVGGVWDGFFPKR